MVRPELKGERVMRRRLERRGGLTPGDHDRLAEAIWRARAGVLDAIKILGGINDRPALWEHQRRAYRAEMVLFNLVRGLIDAERGDTDARFKMWDLYMHAEGAGA